MLKSQKTLASNKSMK